MLVARINIERKYDTEGARDEARLSAEARCTACSLGTRAPAHRSSPLQQGPPARHPRCRACDSGDCRQVCALEMSAASREDKATKHNILRRVGGRNCRLWLAATGGYNTRTTVSSSPSKSAKAQVDVEQNPGHRKPTAGEIVLKMTMGDEKVASIKEIVSRDWFAPIRSTLVERLLYSPLVSTPTGVQRCSLQVDMDRQGNQEGYVASSQHDFDSEVKRFRLSLLGKAQKSLQGTRWIFGGSEVQNTQRHQTRSSPFFECVLLCYIVRTR